MIEVAAVAVLIEPGQHAAPAGHADGSRVVVILEVHAITRELVEVWCDDVRVPRAAQRADGLVVGEQKDDVGFFDSQRRAAQSAEEKKDSQVHGG